jgi:hypothetical protein
MEIDNRRKKKKIIAFALLGAFIVAAIVTSFVVLRIKKSKQEKNLKGEIQNIDYQADIAYDSMDSKSAISGYKRIIDMESDKEVQAIMKIKMGRAYLNDDEPGSMEKGLDVLMEVAADKSLSRQRTAEAITVMQFPFFVTHEADFPQKLYEIVREHSEVFGNVAENWNPRNPESNKTFFFRDIQEFINSEFENSLAYYRIAAWYSGKILDDPTMSSNEKEKLLLDIKDNLDKGNQFLFQLKEESNNDYTDDIMEWLSTTTRHLRFFNYLVLGRYDEKLAENASREYEDLLKLYNKRSSGKTKQRLEGYTRFYYAAFLADKYGSEKKEEINFVLQPIIISSNPGWKGASESGIWKYFDKTLKASESQRDHAYGFLIKLASLDDDFKIFLLSRGYEI